MRIVVDLGCRAWDADDPVHGDDSVSWLIENEKPDILFGFDPSLTEESVGVRDGVLVVLSRKAAWVRSCWLHLEGSGNATQAVEATGGDIEGFDFCEWLRALPVEADIIIKLDVEGAEYQLLAALVAEGLISRISLLHVEYHGNGTDAENSREQVRLHGGNIVDWWL